VAVITALGKTVAMVGKAEIELNKWCAETREKLEAKIAATSAKLSEAAREGGLSPALEEKIRNALLEIKL
jgi:hypothetical protein